MQEKTLDNPNNINNSHICHQRVNYHIHVRPSSRVRDPEFLSGTCVVAVNVPLWQPGRHSVMSKAWLAGVWIDATTLVRGPVPISS